MMNSQKFSRLFLDNLLGSSTFEILKLVHNILMMSFLTGDIYGLIGTLFATLYFAARVADAGTAYVQAPFFKDFTESKKSFLSLFIKRYCCSIIPLVGIVSCVAGWFIRNNIGTTIMISIVIALLVFLETIRSILRQFFHTAGTSRPVIIGELVIFIGYTISLWASYFIVGLPITPHFVFMLYAADSLFCLLFFAALLKNYYIGLPQQQEVAFVIPEGFTLRTIKTRLFYWLLRITKQLFTSNIITPLFALRFGLKEAGIFYLASTLANSIYAITRSAVGHPGNALFAQLKDATKNEKKDAFGMVFSKLFLIIIPIIIFLSVNYHQLLAVSIIVNPTTRLISFTILYLLITFYDLFSLTYEQFYILEEATPSLFSIKALEALFFYYAIFSNEYLSPLLILIMMTTIRSLTFSIMAINAYLRWGVKPLWSINRKYIYSWISISALCLIALKFMR